MLIIKKILLITFFCMASVTLSHAKSFIPKDVDIVLYKIPASSLSYQKQTRLRSPTNKSVDWISVNKKIESLLVIGRVDSDPRYFGQAEAIIRPYLQDANVPHSTLLLWADILQHGHEYSASLTVLDSILNRLKIESRRRNQSIKIATHLMRATIYIAQGNVKKAMQDCRALIGKTSMLISITCIAQAKSVTGELERSRLLLSAQLNNVNPAMEASDGSSIRAWAYTTLGEISMHLALERDAEKSFQNGLRHNPNDYYLAERYCDLLIEQKRFIECITLVKDKTHVTPLLLRAAISEKNIEQSKSRYYRSLIKKKLDIAPDTGRGEHLRDLAIYNLTLRHNSKLAYKYASQNWQTQKQFEDALILVQAANSLGRDLDSLEAFQNLTEKFPLDSRVKKLIPSTYQKVVLK